MGRVKIIKGSRDLLSGLYLGFRARGFSIGKQTD